MQSTENLICLFYKLVKYPSIISRVNIKEATQKDSCIWNYLEKKKETEHRCMHGTDGLLGGHVLEVNRDVQIFV